MPSPVKWESAYADRGSALTTELNSLANDARSDAGSELANHTNLDQYAKAELTTTFGSAPSAGGYVALYAVVASDGTNYEDGSSSADPGNHRWLCNIPVRATTSAQRIASPLFPLEPAKTKFLLLNKTGQTMASSGSVLKVFTTNDEAQ
jgi:hypothetical protein